MISLNDILQLARWLFLSKMSEALQRWLSRILITTLWVSAFLFGWVWVG